MRQRYPADCKIRAPLRWLLYRHIMAQQLEATYQGHTAGQCQNQVSWLPVQGPIHRITPPPTGLGLCQAQLVLKGSLLIRCSVKFIVPALWGRQSLFALCLYSPWHNGAWSMTGASRHYSNIMNKDGVTVQGDCTYTSPQWPAMTEDWELLSHAWKEFRACV